MKTYKSIFRSTLTLIPALAAGTAKHAEAQVVWSSIASSCVVQTAGQNLAYLDAEYGTFSSKATCNPTLVGTFLNNIIP